MEEARTQDELHLSLASSRIDGARSSPEQDRATSSGIGFIRRRGQFQLEQGPFGIVARTEKVQEKLKDERNAAPHADRCPIETRDSEIR